MLQRIANNNIGERKNSMHAGDEESTGYEQAYLDGVGRGGAGSGGDGRGAEGHGERRHVWGWGMGAGGPARTCARV